MFTSKTEMVEKRYSLPATIDFDTSCPQTLLDHIRKVTGEYCTLFVYAYAKDGGQGLLPLTDGAKMLLRVMEHVDGERYYLPFYEAYERERQFLQSSMFE